MSTTTDTTAADPSTQAEPAPAPRRASEPTAADLKAAIERADAQVADLEGQLEATRTAHRDATHAALLAGQDAPGPVAKQSALEDRLAALRGARTALAEQHAARLLQEQGTAANDAATKAREIHAEWQRRWALALAACWASYDAFARLTGHLPDENLVRRDFPAYSGRTRAKFVAELQSLRSPLAPDFKGAVSTDLQSPTNHFDHTMRQLASNHIAGLFE